MEVFCGKSKKYRVLVFVETLISYGTFESSEPSLSCLFKPRFTQILLKLQICSCQSGIMDKWVILVVMTCVVMTQARDRLRVAVRTSQYRHFEGNLQTLQWFRSTSSFAVLTKAQKLVTLCMQFLWVEDSDMFIIVFDMQT